MKRKILWFLIGAATAVAVTLGVQHAVRNLHILYAVVNPSEESELAGVWYCSRENSCNDMEITLTISDNGNGEICFTRDMVGDNPESGSLLGGEMDLLNSKSAYAQSLQATYSVTDDVLTEHFASNGRSNKYVRK